MARTIAIIQARMGSTRLPGKILKPILGEPMLVRMLERVRRAQKLDETIVATTDMPEDDPTAEVVSKADIKVFRGSERDVLDRYYKAAKEAGAEIVMRLTGDCPLMDPVVIDRVISHFEESKGKIDYTSTPSNYPEGLDTEVFTFSALEEAARKAKLPSEREHVSPYIKNHPERFTCESWQEDEDDYSQMHWSVDTQADFDFVTKIFEQLYPTNPSFNKDDILALLAEHPEFLEINKGGTGYEGLAKSLREDEEFKKHSL
jgi:spore coat polysaccharide biosynthesis protein SpsF (cytidylyltransferase family)